MIYRIQLRLISVSELCPTDCLFMLISGNLHSVHPITHSLFMISSCSFIEMCIDQDDLSDVNMVVPHVLVLSFCPFDFFPKYSCASHKSVTIWDKYYCNFIVIIIRSRRCFAYKNGYSPFLSYVPLIIIKLFCTHHNSVTVTNI